MERDPETLEDRIAKLEIQARRWKRATMLAGIAGAAWFGLGAAASKSRTKLVEATEFRLVDQKGTVRASLAVGRGGATISLNNGAGHPRAALVVGEDGAPRLDLLDRTDSSRASLRLAGDGSPELSLSGAPKIELSDEPGKPRASLAILADGEAALSLAGSSEKPRARVAVRSDGCPTLKLLDDDGSIRASLGCTALKEAGTGASADTEASSLVLFDRRGRVVYKAPK